MSTDGVRNLPVEVAIAERTIIGAALQRPGMVGILLRHVRPGLLYDQSRRHILEALIAVAARSEPVETAPVIAELRARGRWDSAPAQELAACMEHFCAPANLPHYCRIVRKEWAARSRVRLALELANVAASDPEAAGAILEQFSAIDAEERGPGESRWQAAVYDGPAFDAVDMPVMPSLLGDGLLCSGELGVVFGPTGKGKSFLCEQLVHAIATGEDWLGFKTVPGGAPVLAVHLELSGARLKQRRLSRWPATPVQLHTTTSDLLGCQVDILSDPDRSALVEVAQSVGAKLIYADPLHELHSAGETNEAFHKVVRALSDVMIRTGAAILIAHHEPKAITEKGAERSDMDSLRGGTRLGGAVKLAMRLKELKSPRHFDLVFAKVTHREAPKSVYLRQSEDGWFVPAERPSEKADRVVSAIERMLMGAGLGTNTTLDKIMRFLGDSGLPNSRRGTQLALDRLATYWGFRSREDIQIGSGRGTGYTYVQPNMGATDASVQNISFAPQDSEEWQ